MKEVKDSGIRLFGMKINALPENMKNHQFEAAGDSTGGDGVNKHVDSDQEKTCLEDKKVGEEREETEKEHTLETDIDTKPEAESPQEMTEASTNSKALPESDESPKTPSIDEDTTTPNPKKTDTTDQSDAGTNSQQKTLKKPDKIPPCPRCNSMDTKFCYYNNYKVNQPRHFCKSCQRYWTAGGTMRNMPVGAGRRKNKNSNSHCRFITISEPFQAARIDGNGNKVLSFGSDSPILESMACAFNLADKKKTENGDDCSSGSSITTSNSVGLQFKDQKKMQEIHGFPSQVPFINPGVNAWPPFPWNSAVHVPAMCPPPGYHPPMPFYPSPFWNCNNFPGAWNFPWLPPPPPPSPVKAQVSDSKSQVLGKHSREGELLKPTNSEEQPLVKQQNSSVLIPKTLRIDDPDEAAKSSIWATLGIKNDNISSRGGLFKPFQAKGEEKNHTATTSPALQANPAALSRSLCFQERA